MRVAAFQFDVRPGDVAGNLATVEEGLREASADGCALVVLPEMWATSFADPDDPAERAEQAAASEAALGRVAELTSELGLAVAGTTGVREALPFGRRPAPDPADERLPLNRFTLLADGAAILEYDKVHLFSPTAEELSFRAGDAPPAVVETGEFRTTASVCYDLRFPELLLPAFRDGASLVLCPAQWPHMRETHWRALALGRAVELQTFVVAANRTGIDVVGRKRRELRFPGNSLIADPHGRVLAEGTGPEGLVAADLDAEVARKIRVRVPIDKDRRDAVYGAW